ncbi:MAG: cyclic nucleotide-binding domain-containing protein, partial [Pseudomonadales bacterium]|nr:cyclic nucleotide-binding domain-containing protein [Pseudomonadales bacterium]
GDKFYVIVQGEAEVLKDGVGKVAELKAGNYFGEDALVSDVPRSATVKMLSDGLLSTLEKEDFKRLLKDSIVEYITPQEADEKIRNDKSYILLDIRSSEEYDHEHSDQSQNIPLAMLRSELKELDFDATYLISKEGGKRSDLAAHLLRQNNINAFVIREKTD